MNFPFRFVFSDQKRNAWRSYYIFLFATLFVTFDIRILCFKARSMFSKKKLNDFTEDKSDWKDF